MPQHEFDALCIGNAIVDVMARTEDDFLVAHGLIKGTMHLIDADRAEMLYDAMGPAIEASGGSAGNTASGIASLGGSAAFIGKVAEDALGKFYRHDMTAAGINFPTAPLVGGAPTARSMILITPDGERTMNTYLGACQELAPIDIDQATVAAAKVTYMEGYLWDPPPAKQAFRQAAHYAHEAGRQASISLSDPFCVDRFRDEFLELLRSRTVDIVFANDSELRSLYKTGSLDAAIEAVRHDCALSFVTVGAEGVIVVEDGRVTPIPAVATDRVEDLSGAGDQLAAGVLFALARDMAATDAAGLGALVASEVIGHLGPRPATSLNDLARQAGFDI